ncbi:hypothetical protein AAHA92_05119 [Salvia divinorum]|uniref:Uncharacterized protein n=1 Tax=Salvia divinorum TaxID=28513 RepID=A0ABD1I1D9_SALDI
MENTDYSPGSECQFKASRRKTKSYSSDEESSTDKSNKIRLGEDNSTGYFLEPEPEAGKHSSAGINPNYCELSPNPFWGGGGGGRGATRAASDSRGVGGRFPGLLTLGIYL